MPWHFGDCVFDAPARELVRAGRPVALSPKAFELLVLLIESRPRPLAQGHLRDALWPDTHVGYTSLARVVSEVRRAVGDSARGAVHIRTVPRFGYAFTGDLLAGPKAPPRSETCALVAEDREYALSLGPSLVGRGPECAVRLPSSQVSRVHAELVVGDCRASLEDRGSKNGTWVNGRRITGPAQLADGDEVLFGTYRLVFRSLSPLTSTRTGAPAPR
jgi:DNA-binding winged helix-turn-helix (wHTH) protein